MKKIIHSPGILTWLPHIITLAAAGIFLTQSIYYAHVNDFVLDEGAYIYKGYLFLTGKYTPYQDYGPWTNHMPLSFLIPGAVQVIFGPGIRVARYYAVATSFLMLAGLWIVSQRMGGRWGGALIVSAMALNAPQIALYATANSQVLVSCMLVWSLVFVMGEGRKPWELLLGCILAGLLTVTRINMSPVLLFLLLYILWQYGKKPALMAALAGGAAVLIVLLIYWPNILYFLAKWLPGALTPMLDAWRLQDPGIPIWNPQLPLDSRINSFLEGFSIHYLSMVGLAGFGLLAMRREFWKSGAARRACAILSTLLAFLIGIHAWAALGQDYCVYCFMPYMSNFTTLGLLVIATALQGLSFLIPGWFTLYTAGLSVAASLGVAFFYYRPIGTLLLNLPVPRASGGRLQPGTAPLQAIIENVFGWQLEYSQKFTALLGGFILAAAMIATALVIAKQLRLRSELRTSTGMIIICLLLAIWYLPLSVLNRNYLTTEKVCGADLIKAYESVGNHLAKIIPAGSLVYWQGALSVAPLLEAPDINIYPPQINDGYAYRIGGNSDNLLRHGLWNSELAAQWQNEAEFIVIEQRRFNQTWRGILSGSSFEQLASSQPANPCRSNSVHHVYRRVTGASAP